MLFTLFTARPGARKACRGHGTLPWDAAGRPGDRLLPPEPGLPEPLGGMVSAVLAVSMSGLPL